MEEDLRAWRTQSLGFEAVDASVNGTTTKRTAAPVYGSTARTRVNSTENLPLEPPSGTTL